jgi:serine/threonine protein kinase
MPCTHHEKFYIFMPQAQSNFTVMFWANQKILRTIKLHWLKEVLEGIKELHAMGIIHRDIRPKNMLIMSNKPARASLCDFGKAVKAERPHSTCIGPIHTLAPEVWSGRSYNNKIDMWAYGFALAEILGYRPKSSRITKAIHSEILELLHQFRVQAAEDARIIDLILNLLAWDPEDRITASQALHHECWIPIEQVEEDHKDIKRENEYCDESSHEKNNKAFTTAFYGQAGLDRLFLDM